MARIELNIVALGDFKSVDSQIKNLRAQVELLNKSLMGTGLSSNLTRQLNDANSAFKSSMLSTGQFTETTVKLRTETEKFGHALVSGKLKLGEYFSVIRGQSSAAATSMRALAVEQTKLQNSIVTADPTKKGVFSVYTPTNIDAIANKTKIATNYQNLFNIAVDKGSQSLINWGKNTQWAGRQLTVGLTVPMAMFGSAAMKTFQQVNDELVRLQKVYGNGITQPTQKALDDIKGQVVALTRELASSMGVAAQETAAMAAGLAATGQTGNELIGATREAMRLARLGELDQQSAMQATVSLQNVYKLSTQDLTKSIDFLNAVENQTSTSLQDLVDGIPRVGPIVQQLGGSFKDTAVMMVAMKEAGVPAAQSANAIKSALASLINPSKNATEAFAGFNINLKEISTSTGGNPVQMFIALQKSMEGLAPLAKAQLIEKLFGKYQQARIQALITNLGSVTSQTKTAFELVNASAPQLAALAASEMKVATESTTGKFRRAVETIKADIIPLGEKIMEVATVLLKFGDSIAKAFGSLPGPVKTVLGVLAGASALVGPIIMLVGLMGNFAGYILKTVFNLKNLIMGTKTFGELFTPEMVASQNAAELFGNRILEDVGAVDLLNQSVAQLIGNLNGMNMAMNGGTGSGIVPAMSGKLDEVRAREAGKLGVITPANTPLAGPSTQYKPTLPTDFIRASSTTGMFLGNIPGGTTAGGINGLLSGGGAEPSEIEASLKSWAGSVEKKRGMYVTSMDVFIDSIEKTRDEQQNLLISSKEAKKLIDDTNINIKRTLDRAASAGVKITEQDKIVYNAMEQSVVSFEKSGNKNAPSFRNLFNQFQSATGRIERVDPRTGQVVTQGGSRELTLSDKLFGKVKVPTDKLSAPGGIFGHFSNPKQIESVLSNQLSDVMPEAKVEIKPVVEKLDNTQKEYAAGIVADDMYDVQRKAEEKEQKKQARRRSLKFGAGMALVMGGQMLASKMPEGSAASSIAGATSTGAGLGMMFGPEAALAGAAIGALVGGIKSLIDKEKEQAAMAKATFTASSDVASFFGSTIEDTTHKMVQFDVATKNASNSLTDGFAEGIKYSASQLTLFKEMIDALPEDNTLALVLKNIKETSDGGEARKLAQDFAQMQMAISGISKDQADQLMQMLLTLGGKNATGAGVSATDQITAIKNTLRSMKVDSKEFSEFIGNLTNIAVNTGSWEKYKQIIDLIGNSAKTSKAFVDSLYQSLLLQGDTRGAQLVASLEAQEYTPVQIINILKAQAEGVPVTTNNKKGYFNLKPGDKKATIELEEKIRIATEKNAAAKEALNLQQERLNKSTEASLKPLETQQKILEANLKTLQDAQRVRQQENSFAATKQDLKNQILMAQANGDNLKAQLLQQELMAKSQDFGFQKKIDEAQAKLDANKAQIDAIKDGATKVSTAISNAATKIANAINPPVPTDTKMGTNSKDAIPLKLSKADAFAAINFPGLSSTKKFIVKKGIEEGQTFSIDYGNKTYVFKLTEDGKIIRMKTSDDNSAVPASASAAGANPKSIWSTMGNFGGKPLAKFNSPSVSANAYSPSGVAAQTYNNGGLTINTAITVGTVTSVIDFQKLIDENNKKMFNALKMNGSTSKVGGR